MARTKRSQLNGHCVWTNDDDGPWTTDCGQSFEFTTDGPRENKFNYCYFCGRALKAAGLPRVGRHEVSPSSGAERP